MKELSASPERETRVSDRSEFLIGQMSQWIEDLSRSGRVEHLFELEMWLKSFERYFRVSNQPQARESHHALAIRSFYEEVALVAQAVHRVKQLCTRLASEDQVNQERFDKYVENFLRDGEVTDPYIARLLHQSSPQAGLALLRESFEDLYLILSELTKLSRVPYATFQSIGRLIYREIRRDEHLALLMEKRFKPAYDRIQNERVSELVHRIEDKDSRRFLAKVFLEFFRLLHYLEFADPKKLKPDELRTTVLIFSLITSEARTTLDFIQRGMAAQRLPQLLKDTLDSFVYCVPLELKKVIHSELSDLYFYNRADTIYTRIENSHGILRDCFQQSVVQLAQVLEPGLEGKQIFSHFETKLEQSLALRESLVKLLDTVHLFQRTPNEISAENLKRNVAEFYERSLKNLMYRDWGGFGVFFGEILKCESIPGLTQIAHRFDTYLVTLLREVSKRAVLQGVLSPRESGTNSQ